MPKPAGHVFIGDPGSDRVIEADTLRCVHCGAHWVPQPGSRKRRGFCTNCNGPVCGAPGCRECVPVEQKLENMEQDRPVDHRRILVPSGLVFPPGVA